MLTIDRRLCGSLNACRRVTITNRIAHTGKLNSNSNLQIQIRIFKLHFTSVLWVYNHMLIMLVDSIQ